MSSLMLAGILAGMPVATILALVLVDSRRTPPGERDAGPIDQPVNGEPARPGRLCIVSQRARCACGHARQRHQDDAGDGCGCEAFVYAGGLVTDPGQLEPMMRTA